jgi:hypothetical protein
MEAALRQLNRDAVAQPCNRPAEEAAMPKVRQPRAKTIPIAKHKNYTLLWDCAKRMAAQSTESVERCWLRIMDGYWAGELSQLFCFAYPKSSAAAGRALLALPPREVMAGHLLGHQRDINGAALAELGGWTLNDYQRDEPFRFYVNCDPRFGLAVRRADFERWWGSSHDRDQAKHPARRAGAKPTKRETVERFIAENYPNEIPAAMTAKQIARDVGIPELSERTVRRALGRK